MYLGWYYEPVIVELEAAPAQKTFWLKYMKTNMLLLALNK